MNSLAACTSCAMPTADEENHPAAGTTHPHCHASAIVLSLFTAKLLQLMLKSVTFQQISSKCQLQSHNKVGYIF